MDFIHIWKLKVFHLKFDMPKIYLKDIYSYVPPQWQHNDEHDGATTAAADDDEEEQEEQEQEEDEEEEGEDNSDKEIVGEYVWYEISFTNSFIHQILLLL